MRGISSPDDLKNLQAELRGQRGSNSKRNYAHVDNGQLVIDWPYHGGGWVDAAPQNHAEMLTIFGIPSSAPFYPTLLGILGLPKNTPITRGWAINVKKDGGGDPFGSAWNAVQQGVGSVVSVADTLKIPGVNFTANLLTGKDPIAGLKKDLSNFTDSAAIAKGIVSGDTGPLVNAINAGTQKFGVTLPSSVVSAAVSAAKSGDISKAATLAMGPDYSKAWEVATNGGKLFDAALPAPPGKSYAPNAVPAQSTDLNAHPAVAAAQRTPLKLQLAKTPLKTELHPEVKAAVAAATGISPNDPVLKAKKNPWWRIGGAAGGATAGALVAGPPGALVGGAVGLLAGHLKSKSEGQ